MIDADFAKSGDPGYFWTEHVSASMEIALTWHDIGEPLLIHTQPNAAPNRDPTASAPCSCRRWLRD